jgi:DNA-binding response OmpR family regulator
MLPKPNVKTARLSHINVLVADGDQKISLLVRRVLVSLGFGAIYLARNGEEAMRTLREKPVDIIVTEWDIGPTSGLEFINQVRTGQIGINRMTPVIMLTGKAQRKYVESARDVGMTEFVVKPFTVRTLCDRIILVVENPRNFILSPGYCGPDRRRKGDKREKDERRTDADDPSIVVARHKNAKVVRIKDQDITIVDPDFTIQQKIGMNISLADVFSRESVRKAQEIINASQGEFLEWIVEDIRNLERAYQRIESNPGHSSDDVQMLYSISTKIKSQAGTFGFDLASHVAESLMLVVDGCPLVDSGRRTVVRKHIDVLYVIFQRNIQGMGGRIGRDLMENLNLLTRKYSD